MRIYDRNRTSTCAVEIPDISLGRVAVYGDRITIECRCKALDEFLGAVIAPDIYDDDADLGLERDDVLTMFVPNIQRRRFDIMFYVLIQDGAITTTKKFLTNTSLSERRLIVDKILSHRESISDDLYAYYAKEYERWREPAGQNVT